MRPFLLSTALLCAAGAAPAQDLFRPAADSGEVRGTDLIGMRVYASEAAVEAEGAQGLDEAWEDVGEVNDLILAREGSVEAVLVDIGGFLGIGERQVAVSMEALRFVSDDATAEDADDFFLVMTASREVLEGAPEYGVAGAVDDASGAVAGTAAATGAGVAATAVAVEGAAGEATADAEMAVEGEVVEGEVVEGEAVAEEDLGPAVEDGAAVEVAEDDRAPVAREGFVAADAGTLTADTLQGAAVYDASDERVGEVSELQLTPEGQVEEVVVDVGGFLGIGEKPVLLPMAELDILRQDGGDEVRVYLRQSKEDLEAMDTYEE